MWKGLGVGFLFKDLFPGIAQNAKKAFLTPFHFTVLPVPEKERSAVIGHGDFGQLFKAVPAAPVHEFVGQLFSNLFPGNHVITPFSPQRDLYADLFFRFTQPEIPRIQ